MRTEDKVEALRAENRELREELAAAMALTAQLQTEGKALGKQLAEARVQGSALPSFIKPSTSLPPSTKIRQTKLLGVSVLKTKTALVRERYPPELWNTA